MWFCGAYNINNEFAVNYIITTNYMPHVEPGAHSTIEVTT